MEILFTTNFPSPYRVAFFNEFGKKCNLDVIFEREKALHRDSKWGSSDFQCFTAIFPKMRHKGTSQTISLKIIKQIRKKRYDRIIFGGYSSPSVIFAMIYCILTKRRYCIEYDGGFDKADSRLVKMAKSVLISHASRHFVTCVELEEYIKKFGVSEDRIIRYPFTSVYDCEIEKGIVSDERKKLLKSQLGISEKYCVLAVGQFIRRKGFDLLIKASEKFEENVGFYFIGGTPNEEYLKITSRNNVHYWGFKNPKELKEIYSACDLFVLPTREDIWGLVINEAMARGLPIVTTDKCIAGLTMVDASNGIIVPSEDICSLEKAICDILFDDEKRKTMAEASLKKIKLYTYENMAEVHFESLSAMER